MISSRAYKGSKAKAREVAETTVSFLILIAPKAISHHINYLFIACFWRIYLNLLYTVKYDHCSHTETLLSPRLLPASTHWNRCNILVTLIVINQGRSSELESRSGETCFSWGLNAQDTLDGMGLGEDRFLTSQSRVLGQRDGLRRARHSS